IAQNPQLLEKQYAKQVDEHQMSMRSQVGAAGLERTFDRFLQPVDPVSWVLYRDGQYKTLHGLDDRRIHADNRFYPLTIHTTIDSKLQEQVERILSGYSAEEAAIVVLAADTGDILAMASKPDYDPYSVEPEKGLWRNQAVSAFPPGS